MTNRNGSNRPLLAGIIAGVFGAAATGPVVIGQVRTGLETNAPVETRPFRIVLPSEHLLGDWNGLRTQLEDAGIEPSLTLLTDFAWNPVGGMSQGATEATNLGLSLHFDLDRIWGVEGGSFLLQFSERFGNSLSSEHVRNVFTIQEVFGGE